MTPIDLVKLSSQLAFLLVGFPTPARKAELEKIKQTNPVLYVLIRCKMTGMRSDGMTIDLK